MRNYGMLTLALCMNGFNAYAQQAPVIADYLGEFEGQEAPIMIQHKKQYLHSSGAVVTDKMVYFGFYRLVAGVKNNAYGAFNDAGKVIAPFKYDEVSLEAEEDNAYPQKNYSVVIVRDHGKYGAVDSLGKMICPTVYNEIAVMDPHLLKIKKDGLWGWANMKTGQVLQAPQYDDVNQSYVLEGAVQISNGRKVGLAAADGHILVPAEYESFDFLGYEGSPFFGYTKQNKTGIMHKNGTLVTPAIYDKCSHGPGPDIFAVTQQDKTGFVNAAGKTLLPLQYSHVESLGNFVKVAIGDKKGVVNAAGQEIIPVQYDDIKSFDGSGMIAGVGPVRNAYNNHGMAPYFAVTKGATMGLFDSTGKQVLPFAYSDINVAIYHDQAYIAVQQAGKTGLLDNKGQPLIPVAYEDIPVIATTTYLYNDANAGTDKDDFLPVANDGRIGLFNIATRKEILPPAYDGIEWQNSQLISLRNGDTASLATRNGAIIRGGKQYGFFTAVDTNRIVERRYDNNESVSLLTDITGNVLYANSYWEFRDDQATRLLMPVNAKSDHPHFNNGLLKIWNASRKNLFVDTNGKEVVLEGYSFVGDFYNGLALAGKEVAPGQELFGIIKRNGEIVYPMTLDDMAAFNDSLLIVTKGKQVGLIRKDGSAFLPIAYENISAIYQEALFKVTSKEKEGLVDANGKVILPPVFDYINYREKTGLLEVSKDGKKGIADTNGKMRIPVKYDELYTNRRGDDSLFPILVKEGKWYFYLDTNGRAFPYKSLKKQGYED
ncbi:WG repeat-containing protein [Chitinophaga polysaccharea]|uniref:WG repeat-containing protein n=1 Tax=Chitinophaga polysaccharea TaxID=1293035 RepID=UPI001454F44D|nr:WG repeat-containing protein [Chitinophaga polysaccharea]NLR57862.1 WG repeat-containing protein [Chitinophaga polysaccharea]